MMMVPDLLYSGAGNADLSNSVSTVRPEWNRSAWHHQDENLQTPLFKEEGAEVTQLVPSYDEVIEEVEKIPVEYLPFALEIVRAFRQSITMNSAVESFRQGWHEAQSGKTTPVSDLWVDINNAE